MSEELGTEVPGEGLEGSSQNPQIQEKTYVDKAKELGWRPKDQWEGDSDDWVDAKEFVGRQKLYDKIRDIKTQLHRQSQKAETDMQTVSKYIAEMREREYKRAYEQLKQDRRLALQDQDFEAVEAIEAEIDKTKEEYETRLKEAPVQKPQAGPSPEFQAWQSENSWFSKDMELTKEAIAIGTGYAAANPHLPQEDVLTYVSDRIKKIYPEKFQPRKKPMESNVESGGPQKESLQTEGRRNKLTVNDLNDTEREVMRTLIKRGVLKDVAAKNKRSQEAEYLSQIAEARSR